MKSALTILLITGFMSVAVFGFVGMSHIDEMAHYGCLAALADHGECPLATAAPLASAFFHLDILRSFSLALLNNVLLLLALVGAALFGAKIRSAAQSPIRIRELFLYVRRLSSDDNDFSGRSLSWLVRHLNSPAYPMSA